MAEKMISAGVFTRENDLTFVPQGIAQIGATFVGPTQKGIALVPTKVNTVNDFYAQLGYSNLKTYVPKAVEEYFANGGGTANIVRVLGGEGYSNMLTAIGSPFTSSVSASFVTVPSQSNWPLPAVILAPTVNAANQNISASILPFASSSVASGSCGLASSFVVQVSDGNSYTCSLVPSSPNYIVKVFGDDPMGLKSLFVLHNFTTYTTGRTLGATDYVIALSTPVTQSAGFDHGVTPYIQSQNISGLKYNLFRVHTLNDGAISNVEIKIGIQDIRPGTSATNYFPTFTLVVRRINGTFNSSDLDKRQDVVETWSNLTLDPDNKRNIQSVIGTKYTINQVVDGQNRVVTIGDYDNNSDFIRVEMATGWDAIPAQATPYGFAGVKIPTAAAVTASFYTTTLFNTTQSIDGVYDSRRFFGFDFENADNLNFLFNVPNGAGTSATFSLDDITVPASLTGAPYVGALTNVTGALENRKFLVPFQYGFDGLPLNRVRNIGGNIIGANVFGFDCSGGTTTGTLQYKKALDAVANGEEVDTNLIVTPGIISSLHDAVIKYTKNICETRGDCFYIMDTAQFTDTKQTVINTVEALTLDSNYVATYYPWVRVIESSTSKPFWVPPSVVLPSVYANNDQVGYEWFAPAGFNRGGLTAVKDVKAKLNRSDIDALYDARINPIAYFPGQGVVVWGQKTLQVKASAFDRINVRRLLITVKKYLSSISRYLVFEQNTSSTRKRFTNVANPYLANIQQKNGLYAFKVIMDETNNTPDIIDRNIMAGAVYLQPTKTAEFIMLDFNILPTGASFTS